MLCLCLSGGLQAGIRKSNLKVLYVGGSPDVDYVGNRPDSAVLAQSSAKRMASFDKMLKRYFRQVTVIRAKAYRPELSDNYDVTVMDGRPAPILPGIMERDSSGRLTRYEKTGYLPPDFDRPMVKKPMRTLPYIDDTIAPDSLPMWRVGRHGNFLHWGFAASPDDMTEEARDVFANAVVYIAGFAGQTPVARKYNDRIITRHDITLRAFSATRRAYALNVETMKNHAARMEDLKHMICMTPTEKKIVLK